MAWHTEHGYERGILRLSDEFGDYTNIIQGTLSISNTHKTFKDIRQGWYDWRQILRTLQPVDSVRTTSISRVVPSVLAPRVGMKIEVDS